MQTNKTWNQYVVKQENKFLVLETVKNNTPLSRAEIANITSLNKGTVSSLVSELIEENLIYESGPGQSSGGRRPVMLHFNKVAGYSIGIDIGVNYILGLLTDLDGNIVEEKYIHYHHLTYDEIMDELFQIIDHLISVKPSCPYGIIGIGIGIPGTVSIDGEVLLAPNLHWENIQLKKVIHEKYQLPVVIENEANAGAYGETKYGVGKDLQHIIYVSIGIGIGVGMILNGKLYRGNNGFSGELGHMTIDLNGHQCGCGKSGCWELYASEQSLLMKMETLGISPPSGDKQHLEHLLELAENHDQRTIQLFEQIGNYIGLGMNNIINIFNPEQVIIGNRMASAKKWLEEPLNKHFKQTLWFQREDLQIDFSGLSTHSAALGMSAFSIEHFLLHYQSYQAIYN